MMRYILVAALLTASPALATTTVLDFNAANACSGLCFNTSLISQSYGDSAAVNVTYTSRSGVGNTSEDGFVRYWSTGYSGLPQVAYSGNGVTAVTEIRLAVNPGFKLTLDSFDVGSWLSASRVIEFNLFDLGYNSLVSYPINGGPSTAGNTFFGFETTTGYILQIGPDGFNGGISNLTFTTEALSTAVPEPASWAMLISGFGLIGAVARRRRLAQAA